MLRGLAIALLVSNIGIVITGGAVRLTDSGLGCPTWPRCTDESYVPHGELGIHGVVEFGNRLLTFVLAAIALATWLALLRAVPRRRVATRLAFAIGLGIPAQAVVGGLTVLTNLDPWVVNLHLMVSMALIVLGVVLIARVDEADEPARSAVPGAVRALARLTFAATVVVVYVGTIVTGSGPYAGDAAAVRNGLDPDRISQLHADAVFLLVGLTIGLLFALRAVGAPRRSHRAVSVLLAVELSQGVVGFVQYFTGLPVIAVGLHLAGAALVMAAATGVLVAIRHRPPVVPDPATVQATSPELPRVARESESMA